MLTKNEAVLIEILRQEENMILMRGIELRLKVVR